MLQRWGGVETELSIRRSHGHELPDGLCQVSAFQRALPTAVPCNMGINKMTYLSYRGVVRMTVR